MFKEAFFASPAAAPAPHAQGGGGGQGSFGLPCDGRDAAVATFHQDFDPEVFLSLGFMMKFAISGFVSVS